MLVWTTVNASEIGVVKLYFIKDMSSLFVVAYKYFPRCLGHIATL